MLGRNKGGTTSGIFLRTAGFHYIKDSLSLWCVKHQGLFDRVSGGQVNKLLVDRVNEDKVTG